MAVGLVVGFIIGFIACICLVSITKEDDIPVLENEEKIIYNKSCNNGICPSCGSNNNRHKSEKGYCYLCDPQVYD